MMNTEYFKEIFQLLPTPVVVLLPNEPNFTVVALNDAYLDLIGAKGEDIIGKSFFQVVANKHYLQLPEWTASFHKVINDKVPDRVATQRYISHNPNDPFELKHLDVVHVPVLDENNELTYIIRHITDVTQAANAQLNAEQVANQLKMKENFLNETQRVATSGSWEIDLVTNKVTWSDVQKEIHDVGLSFEPEMMSVINFFKEGKDRKTMVRLISDAINTGSLFDVDLTIVTAKGQEKLVRMTGKADIQGVKCLRIYGVTQDITESKTYKLALIESRKRYQSLLQTVEGIVWEADASNFRVLFFSEQLETILGYTMAEWTLDPMFWTMQIHPDDRDKTVADYKRIIDLETNSYTFDYRMKRKDGRYIWIKDIVSLIRENGEPVMFRGLMIDVTLQRSLNELEQLERITLELNAKKGATLNQVLTEYLLGVERIFPKIHCSILRVKHGRLYNLAAPGLPEPYLRAVEGLPIGKSIGSCGASAFLKQPIIVSDIENDIRWASYKEIALKAKLRACWSYPIFSVEGEVIATFGLYYNKPKAPAEEEIKIIEHGTALIGLILENRLNAESLQETTEQMNQGQQLAHFGNWSWDIKNDVYVWSDSLYAIYGMDKSKTKPNLQTFLDILHPEDKTRVSAGLGKLLSLKGDLQTEERIIRPDGEVRTLRSWCKVKTDEKGVVVKLFGASLDITENKQTALDLENSEQMLKSLIETQTTYVVRFDFKGLYTYCNPKYIEDFAWRYGGEDIIGQDALRAVYANDYEQLFDVAEKCISHPNEVFQVEIDRKKSDGSLRTLLWDFICLVDAAGLPTEIQGTGIDVTDRKRAEDALKVSNDRYKYVNMATKDAIYDWDILEDQIHWGEGFSRLFGYPISSDNFSINDWATHVHPDELIRVKSSLDAVLNDASMPGWHAEYRFKRFDGEYSDIEESGYIIRNEEGTPQRIIGVMRDVTERKMTESALNAMHHKMQENLKVMELSNAELLDSKKRYFDLFHFSPQPMYVYDPETLMFLDVNEAAVDFYGYTKAEFLSMDITRLRPTEEIPELLIHHGVFRHLKKDGSIVHVEVQSNSISFNQRDTYLVVAKDISDRLTYLETVEKQNEAFKEISWMQSHAVRGPLSRMMSLIDLITMEGEKNEEQLKLLNYLLSAAHELDQIVKEISRKTEAAALNTQH